MQKIIKISDDFWNIRGTFRIGGVVNVGTHASLVRMANGKFVFLDAYTFSGSVARELRSITGDGSEVEAVINLHPFHTVHVKAMHRQFPKAKMYGTARHLSRFPQLPWEALRTEEDELHGLFSEDFEFSVPDGVDFISANENVHFSSVLAYHRVSKTLHVDDTFMYVQLPGLMRIVGLKDATSFHPTLVKALQPRAGAAQDFRQWAESLTTAWGDAQNLCAAHMATLTAQQNRGASIQQRLRKALAGVEGKLKAHERKYKEADSVPPV